MGRQATSVEYTLTCDVLTTIADSGYDQIATSRIVCWYPDIALRSSNCVNAETRRGMENFKGVRPLNEVRLDLFPSDASPSHRTFFCSRKKTTSKAKRHLQAIFIGYRSSCRCHFSDSDAMHSVCCWLTIINEGRNTGPPLLPVPCIATARDVWSLPSRRS